MINEWRKLWSTNTPTSDKFPFGFMQLSTWDANQNTGFPAIRWHQTADHGYVPNEVMEVSNYCFLPLKVFRWKKGFLSPSHLLKIIGVRRMYIMPFC